MRGAKVIVNVNPKDAVEIPTEAYIAVESPPEQQVRSAAARCAQRVRLHQLAFHAIAERGTTNLPAHSV